MDIKIDARQLKRLQRSLSRAGVDYKKGTKRLLTKIGVAVQGLARAYCPESPTKSQYASMNKSGVTKRKSSSITTGSLRDSITVEAKPDQVSINVPSNSRGGGYGEKVHEKQGINEWGVRTKQKGAKAKEKFIYRAYDDAGKDIDKFVDQTIAELTRNIGI